MMRRLALMALAVVTGACGATQGVEVDQLRLGRPIGPNAALYMTISSGSSDRLIGASTEAAARVELHETTMTEDGSMVMRSSEGFEVGSDELILEPGGKHLMLVEADRLEVGDTIEVTLTFETAGDVMVSVPVVEPQDVLAHKGGDHG